MDDPINPAHYVGANGMQVVDIVDAYDLDFYAGNTGKYLCRAGRKPGASRLEDLRKARWYIDRLVQLAEAEGETERPPEGARPWSRPPAQPSAAATTVAAPGCRRPRSA